MKDPLVHAEKTIMPGWGITEIRKTATGWAASMPGTTGTSCGKRRPLAATSRDPAKITCPACRESARGELLFWAGAAETAAQYAGQDPGTARKAGTDRAKLTELARQYRTAADAFGPPDTTEKGPANG